MRYRNDLKVLQRLIKEMDANKYNLKHPLQRKANQWNNEQKSNLIASLLQEYPINSIYIMRESGATSGKGKLAVLDGLQRMTTMYDFVNNQFAIQRNYKSIDVGGVKVEIKGKKFKSLPEELQDKILDAQIQICEITDYTEDNIKEMFYRQNSGAPLSKCQKATALISYKTLEKFEKLREHSFWEHTGLSAASIKKDVDREVIIEAMALIKDGDDVKNFNKKYLYDEFMQRMEEDKEFDDLFTEIEEIMIALLPHAMSALEKIKRVTLPVVIYGGHKSKEIGKNNYVKYANWLKNFVADYDTNEDYKQFCQAGSAQKKNVLGRKKYFDDEIEKLRKKK